MDWAPFQSRLQGRLWRLGKLESTKGMPGKMSAYDNNLITDA